MTQNIRIDVDADGIALVTLDVQDRPMNVFTPQFTEELGLLADLLASRADVVGAVLTSGKSNGFFAGADLKDLVGVHARGLSAAEAGALVKPAGDALRRLERCCKPVAAAINGAALGGGFELCLACHHRVLADDSAAVVGLPEVTVGLLPAGGGTQRLPRLIGIAQALPLLLSGRRMAGAEALSLGLVDAVVPAAELIAVARRWVLANAGFQQPWDRKGFSVPGGAGAMAPHAVESFGIGMARVRRDTQDNYPAPPAILRSVYEGTQLPFERSLQVEAAYFGELLAGPVARNLIRTQFIHRGAARKLARRPTHVPPQPVRRLGVVGAGMMGGGIAQVAAASGIDVVLLDATHETAAEGKARIAAAYERECRSGRCTPEQAKARLSRIHVAASYAELRGCDFVIEAVFEDRGAKASAFAGTAEGLGPAPAGFVMATNTSTLPVTGLAGNWPDAGAFIGLHFFSPVDRMALVEVILGKETSPQALARSLDFAAQLGKTPIVVNDSPGFYTSRIFCAYIDEGMAMLAEGVAPALVENAARQAGFATGPLAVTDEVSLDLQERVMRQAAADGLPEQFRRRLAQPVVDAMLAAGRLGCKSGGGFHDFAPGTPKVLWTGLRELFPVAAVQPDVHEVRRRLLYIQALESARCMAEGVVPNAADADLGSVYALGFPAWTGGTLSLIDTVGLARFVRECDELADRHGERFRPCEWLRRRMREGKTFHE
jgi:3-hydroxyacyl-CoA dehydrogenase/enoyl-CoA hydratase/3-hydroxybutyryl-CoA epimerase